MHKIIKLSSLLMFGAVVATSCGGGGGGGGNTSGKTSKTSKPTSAGPTSAPVVSRGKLQLWHNFGANYSTIVDDTFVATLGDAGIEIEAESQGSYDGILEKMISTSTTKTYPNIATGYPDHLATYARWNYPRSITGALVDLNEYLDDAELNAAHKAATGYNLREDYYEEYMVENNSISYSRSEPDKFYTVGLPFNKSTEVIGYNGIFYDYVEEAETKAGRTIKVPETWDEWKQYGPVFRSYQKALCGKYLCGDKDSDLKGSNFYVSTNGSDPKKLLDFSRCEEAKSAVLSWDSLANMFITLVRQFDSQFTSYTLEDRQALDVKKQHGYMEFYSGENKAKTVAAMQLVRDLYDAGVFATPKFFGSGYASTAFADNKVLFTVCSTGGLSYNINEGQRFRIAPIPYKDADHKFVISQGANITILDQKDLYNNGLTKKEVQALAFETVVKMTTGDYQATWAKETGYYPASRSATESKIYQDFLASDEVLNDPIKRAYREGAQLNEKHYMNKDEKWTKFVDPGFTGSSTIRKKADSFITTILGSPEATIDSILAGFYADSELKEYVRS